MTTRSPAEIEAELTAARERLTSNIAALVGEVHPKLVARRTVEDAKQDVKRGLAESKQTAADAVAAARSWLMDNAEWLAAEVKARFADEDGVRWDRVAAAGAALAAAGGLVALLAHRKH